MPFTAMVTMECTNVGLNTLYKATTLGGMSPHVSVVDAYGVVAALVLLASPFFSQRILLKFDVAGFGWMS
ncbi:unnamed protein product [Ilex paraguariensis]|uniref:Uncharacterized protein n=1 Tax=Ilex paraguariensis TaxID=185542 RepID=A0ABC8UI47_9AQUA